MIAEISRSPSFHKLLHYAGGKEKSELLDSNLPHTDMGDLADAMTAQARTSRSKKPCYHISVSPAEGDRLDEPDWLHVIDRILEGMQLERLYQYVGILHFDAKYKHSGALRPHLHLIANLVGYDGRVAATYDDYGRMETTMRQIESELGLQPVESNKTLRSLPQERTPDYVETSVATALESATSQQELFANLQELGIQAQRSGRGWKVSWQDKTRTGQEVGFSWTTVCARLHSNQSTMPELPDIPRERKLKERKPQTPKTVPDLVGEFGTEVEAVTKDAPRNLYLAGDGIAATGAAVSLGVEATAGTIELIQDLLNERADTNNQQRLGLVGERVSAAEERVAAIATVLGSDIPDKPRTAKEPDRTFANLQWVTSALVQIDPENASGLSSVEGTAFPTALDAQLSVAEAALDKIAPYLERLESDIDRRVANSLWQYADSRRTYSQEDNPQPLHTPLGTINHERKADSASLEIAGPDAYPEGVNDTSRFQAIQRDGSWQVERNALSAAEKSQALQLPQSVAEVRRHEETKAVVFSLMEKERDAFVRPGKSKRQLADGLTLTVDNEGEERRVRITDDRGDLIFRARLQGNTVLPNFSESTPSDFHLSAQQFSNLTARDRGEPIQSSEAELEL